MRQITFEIFARSGIPGDVTTGTVADLLENYPYLLISGVIPPLCVVNDLLLHGITDAGMSGGCRWEPFQISAEEWAEARAALETSSDEYRYVEPAPWVKNYNDWYVWLFEFRHGVPADEHRRLNEQEAQLRDARDKARAAGDEEAASELEMKRWQADEELAEFMMKYLRPPRS